MKRILILFIVLLLVLPIFAFPVSAETQYEFMTFFMNGKYTVAISGDDAMRTQLIKLLEESTNVPYSYEEENITGVINFVRDPEIEDGIYYVESSITFVCNEKPIEELLDKFSKQIKLQTAYDGSSAWVVDITSFKALYEEDDNGEKAEEEKKKEEDEAGFFENAGKFFKGIGNLFGFFKDINIDDTRTTIESGGYNYMGEQSRLNLLIASIYKVLYPIGFAVMLLCWCFGVAKSTISSSLDIKDRNSIIHSVLSLILGLAAMSLAPQILTTLTGVSQWLCSLVGSAEWLTWENWETVSDIDLYEFFSSAGNNITASLIVAIIIDYVFMLNILWIALLQCLSPIFIGLMANQATRKISFNFIKEYFKAILIPVVTLAYYRLVSTLLWDIDVMNTSTAMTGLIGSLVLGISTISIAGKKLDKLIN